ncbi:MAG: hypothetical protein R3B09_06675 [Nannocystaceae bacterium]
MIGASSSACPQVTAHDHHIAAKIVDLTRSALNEEARDGPTEFGPLAASCVDDLEGGCTWPRAFAPRH